MAYDLRGFNVISFYTPDYSEVAARLKKSCVDLGITHEIMAVPSKGSWVAGCAFKPKFIRQMWELSKKPVIWVDADAIIRKHPDYFNWLTSDIAVHFRNDKRYKNELLSGTVFFNKTEGAWRIINEWVKTQEQAPDTWDQRTLQQVVEGLDNISVYRLPASYTQIYDTMKDRGEPVIEHFQESRAKDKTARAYNMINNNP